MQRCGELRVRRQLVRQRLLQQRGLRDDRARQRLWDLGRAMRRLLERPAVQRLQLCVRRDVMPEWLLR